LSGRSLQILFSDSEYRNLSSLFYIDIYKAMMMRLPAAIRVVVPSLLFLFLIVVDERAVVLPFAALPVMVIARRKDANGGIDSAVPHHGTTAPGLALPAGRRGGGDKDDDSGGYYSSRDAFALNKARTDIRNFLTQRAMQSFIFLLINCRDEATVRWLEVS
jgi:hypothetical protein